MHLPHTLIVKLFLSVLIGGAIGLERELRSKSAGFRTLTLICVGATLFTILSQYIGQPNNTDRIASNIVVGIGFLGAGVIFRSERGVSGITTAASIWLTAALGMGIGCGYFAVALLGCIVVLSILFLFSFFDRFLDSLNQIRQYRITYPYEEKQQHKYETQIKHYHLKILSRSVSKNGNIMRGTWSVAGSEKKHRAFIEHMLTDCELSEFDF